MPDDARHVQLDALRAFAVGGVILAHAWRPDLLPGPLAVLDAGHLGVQLFFVLSGFLITGILLRERDRAEAEGRRGSVIGRFYGRRALRIFPIYYLLIASLFLIDFQRVRELAPWLFSYTTNLYIAGQGEWIGDIGHFWTLAVEEQFYLVWPWLVMFLPRRWLGPILVCFIASAPISRAVLVAIDPVGATVGLFPRGTFTLAAWDSLGIGALVAVLSARSPSPVVEDRLRHWFAPLVATIVGLIGVDAAVAPTLVWTIFGDLPIAILFAWLVLSADHGFGGVAGRVLSHRGLVAIGVVSYGIYAFHMFVEVGIQRGLRVIGVSPIPAGPALFAAVAAGTVVVALASWRFFERPINDLKRLIPYTDRRVTAAAETDSLVIANRDALPRIK